MTVGGVLPDVTVIVNALFAVVVPSFTVTVIVVDPVWPGAGVTVTVRLAPLPPKTMLAVGTRVVFPLAPETVRIPAAVSMSPMVNGNAPVEAGSTTDWFARADMVGGSFTALTVNVNTVLTELVPSLTEMVTVETPFWFATGVRVTVRLPPDPPNSMLAVGRIARFVELPETVSVPAAVSGSETVNAMAEVAVSSLTA